MKSAVLVCIVMAAEAWAANSALRGIVHDPQHRPVPGAQVSVRASNSTPPRTAQADANGEFELPEIPEGVYAVTVSAEGFATLQQPVTVSAGRTPVLHFQLELAQVRQAVEVSGATSALNPQVSTVQTLVTPRQIEQTPGADQSNSLAMITDFTPGAAMVHDMLHVRGGHQVSWFFDGIPVINTNIAANVAPLINPKNVEELQVERGGYSSEYGDRTYGFFNVVTPSGFDRDNQAEIIASAGNFYSTDDQFNLGGHTEKFAYYASVDGNRSELGLDTPTPGILHDQASGEGGFLSLLYNPSARDQFRWIASLRDDHYQIPNDSDGQASGTRDLDLERDALVGFHWTHSFTSGLLLTVSPYFHFNNAHYLGGPNDTPFILDDNSRSDYFGARAVLQAQKKRHNVRAGGEIWGQKDDSVFALTPNPGVGTVEQRTTPGANSDALFLEDQYKPASWVTFDLGTRFTHYSGLVDENAFDPRVGAAIRIPWLHWVARGYYAYYYQPPPLNSLTGPALALAQAQGYGFIPLPGERDIQHDFGLTIPARGWSIDIDNFHTSARDFLDHDVIGNSGIFVPLADLGAIISGTEVALRSPRIHKTAELRIAYSNQIANGVGPIDGGLLEGAPSGVFALDHDQRHTVSAVLSLTLPGGAWATPAYQFGSGFLNGNGPAHLPPHSTFDLSMGKNFGEKLSLSANAVNLANTRYLLDNSNTFGGTHWIAPRRIYAEVRYRFHF